MKTGSRFRWQWAAALLCVPLFATPISAQQAAAPQRDSSAALQRILDPFSPPSPVQATRHFSAQGGTTGSPRARGSNARTPGAAPAKLDFNLDTKPDLLFQSIGTSDLVYWLMDGDRLLNYGYVNPSRPGTNWVVVASADFNGDHKADLVLQDTGTGDLIYWLLNGPNQIGVQYFSPRNPGQYWNVVGAADMNGDGFPDLVFQNSLTGDIYVWYMQGATLISGAYINPSNPGPGWTVAAVGDLNGDGFADIVVQKKLLTPDNSSGTVYVWYMQNDTQIGGGFLAPANPGPAWNVAGLVDLLGQGRPQILFQNAGTGDLAYWVMDGLNLVRYDVPKPNNPGAHWRLVGAK